MSRKQQQRKKKILFLLLITVLLLACAVFLVAKYVRQEQNVSFHESTREDTILYDGKEYRYNDHLSNYLFLGIDTREIEKEDAGRTYAGQADAIFLVSLDRAKMTLQCLVIPETRSPGLKVLHRMVLVWDLWTVILICSMRWGTAGKKAVN